MYKKTVLLILMFCLLLSGCYETHRTDYIKKYTGYLAYSLGDYKVTDQQTKKWRGDPIPVSGEGFQWKVSYMDQKGKPRLFTFKNYGNTDGGDDSNFGYAVLTYALELGKEQLTESILRRYFGQDEVGVTEYETNPSKTSVFILGSYDMAGGDGYYASCIDKQDGIRSK